MKPMSLLESMGLDKPVNSVQMDAVFEFLGSALDGCLSSSIISISARRPDS